MLWEYDVGRFGNSKILPPNVLPHTNLSPTILSPNVLSPVLTLQDQIQG